MLRKVLAVIITFTLFLGVLTPVTYGEAKSSILTKAEAEKLARKKLNLNEAYELQYSNLHTRDTQQKQFWSLEFTGEDRNASILMAADSGEIISLNQWDGKNYGKPITLLEEEAKKIAINFIQSLESERFKETEEVTAKAPTVIPYDIKINVADHDNYHFMFVRKINGEFFPNNSFRVTVSGVSGHIISYEMKWDKGSYKGASSLLTEEGVRKIFEKEDRLQLKYISLNKYNQDEGKEVVLTPVYIYTPKETDKIDAITGKLLTFDELYRWNYYGYPVHTADMALEKEAMNEAASGGVVEMIPEAGVLSKEKAEQIVINALKDQMDMEGIKINNTRYTNSYAGIQGRFWYMNWSSKEETQYLNAVVNAKNGEILEVSYQKYDPKDPIIESMPSKSGEDYKKEMTNTDGALRLANEKIQSIFPKIKDELKLEINSENVNNKDHVYVSSPRYINNIPYEGNYVNMSYSASTEEIRSLNYRWYDVKVQNQNAVMDSKKAHKIFYDTIGFEKYLVQLKDLEAYEKEGLELPKEDLLPAYGLKDFGFSYIHALTGKLLDYSGEEFKEENSTEGQFGDIKGSPYEKEILLMNKMGILAETDKNFKPSSGLLRKDALKWIIEIGWSNKAYSVDRYYHSNNSKDSKDYFKDISKDSPYYKYIEAGVEFGIIGGGDYFKPDEQISKMDLAKWMINAMQQKELAKYTSIFQVPYKDGDVIKAEDIGYVALSKYYNIFKDKNMEGKFEPNKNLSRGEWIHLMYQFIQSYGSMNN